MQEALKDINTSEVSYIRFAAMNNLNEKLVAWSISENYILSIQLIDKRGDMHSVGIEPIELDRERRRLITEKAMERHGGIVWIEPYLRDRALVAARMINTIEDLSREPLGTLIIRVNPKRLVDRRFSSPLRYNYSIALITSNRYVFREEEWIDPEKILSEITGRQGYFTADLGETNYLVAYMRSPTTGWMFTSIIPYQAIFEGISNIRIIMIAIYILTFMFVMAIGVKFSKGITDPLETLTSEIKNIENGNFKVIRDLDPADEEQRDEVANLTRNFHLMATKIDLLIKENYIKQIKMKEADLKTLQAQINPHFLYNTLDSINWLSKTGGQSKISPMVKALGNLLRNSINNKNPVIMLSEELQILQDYITIQKMRYEENLEFEMHIPDEYKNCLIPRLTLQPIAENSINYGLEKIPGICRISVIAGLSDERLEIKITDNGPGMSSDFLSMLQEGQIEPKGVGIGLKNIDERIRLIFGEQYGLSIYSELGRFTTISINIPYSGGKDV